MKEGVRLSMNFANDGFMIWNVRSKAPMTGLTVIA